ncbi:MAG: 2-oxoacid:acceptor oxidoreductase family protein [Coriobacteriales bacterium]|jgi:indolepyruvate ferredoxin oxidoreductase beta subunit|nr:2-oxoacid:acceptor oxidoreductase family protein [Coriobacteriales bacterium]
MADVVIVGVGGQGTILASKLLAQAALLEGRSVRTAETIGMAQRGGSVLGHVRVRAPHEGVFSPLVPVGQADLLIGFEPGETVRALGYLREGGSVVTAKRALVPLSATAYDGTAELAYLSACAESGRIDRLALVDGQAATAKLGNPRVLNVVLLGAALATAGLDIPQTTFERAIELLVRPGFVEVNKQALALLSPGKR